MATGVKVVYPDDSKYIPIEPNQIEGWVPDADGTVHILTAEVENVYYPVIGGNYYNVAIRKFYSTGTDTVTILYLHYGRSPV